MFSSACLASLLLLKEKRAIAHQNLVPESSRSQRRAASCLARCFQPPAFPLSARAVLSVLQLLCLASTPLPFCSPSSCHEIPGEMRVSPVHAPLLWGSCWEGSCYCSIPLCHEETPKEKAEMRFQVKVTQSIRHNLILKKQPQYSLLFLPFLWKASVVQLLLPRGTKMDTSVKQSFL